MLRSTKPAEILELSQFTIEPYARGLTPRNVTPTKGGSDTTIPDVLETEQVKKKSIMFQNEVSCFQNEIKSVQ